VKVWWDVQSRGRVNLETAEDGTIGPGNYMQAYYDLSGDTPKREFFWSQRLTEIHEQFHVKEYIDNSRKETAAAVAEVSKKQIKVPMVLGKDEAIQTQVEPMTKDLAKNVGSKVLDTFNAGGEDRAYGAGATAYKTLADAIKAKGEKLGWDKQAKNKANPGMVPRDNMPTDNVPDSDKKHAPGDEFKPQTGV
jgi:hypothetical protein